MMVSIDYVVQCFPLLTFCRCRGNGNWTEEANFMFEWSNWKNVFVTICGCEGGWDKGREQTSSEVCQKW